MGARIAESKETLEKSIAREYEIKLKLDEKIDLTDARTMTVREELGQKGGVGAARDSAQAVGKQIRVLENRLDKSLQSFNQGVATNKRLRDQIDGLRRERVVFDQIYTKLEREFETKKKEMANIIEQANAAYEARDAAQAQMTSLKQQADKEHGEFEKEWKELGRLIENDRKMKDFMRQKERSRALEAEAANAVTVGGGGGSTKTAKDGELTNEDEENLKKKVAKNAWAIARGKVQITGLSERISIYEEAFARIQAATGISDIDDLVANFINAEDSNFSLFNYANLLAAQIEKLDCDIAELKAEHELLKSAGGQTGGGGEIREAMSQLQIKLPSTVEDYTDDEEEDEDDDTRPFTREELKLKTQRGLQRKQEKSIKKHR